ncbi:MAG: ribokinase [Succinivibrio sp.]|nr:ribokinase [Succinivibrio sp.]
MAKILNFGSLNIDYVYSVDHIIKPGETQGSDDRNIFPGGKGLNQSVAASKAGAEVYHAGAVGTDDGQLLEDVLKNAGVKLDYLKRHNVPSGHTIIQVDKNGQNCIILFGGANHSLRRDEIDETIACFDKGDLLVLQNEVNELDYIMRNGAEHGMKIAFNVSPFKEELLKLPLEKCTYLLVNEIEAAGIAGISSDSSADELLQKLNEKLPDSTIIMTLGTRGSVYKEPNKEPIKCGCFKVKAVDSTGSGDTFTGFLLTALTEGQPVEKAMRLAACAAAISVTRNGAASSIPSREEVENSDLFKTEPVFKG